MGSQNLHAIGAKILLLLMKRCTFFTMELGKPLFLFFFQLRILNDWLKVHKIFSKISQSRLKTTVSGGWPPSIRQCLESRWLQQAQLNSLPYKMYVIDITAKARTDEKEVSGGPPYRGYMQMQNFCQFWKDEKYFFYFTPLFLLSICLFYCLFYLNNNIF